MDAASHAPAGDPTPAALLHARRAAGQAGALAAMIEAGRPFADVAQQLLAARGSLDALLERLLERELDRCLPTDELRETVARLIHAAAGQHGLVGVAAAPLDVNDQETGNDTDHRTEALS